MNYEMYGFIMLGMFDYAMDARPMRTSWTMSWRDQNATFLALTEFLSSSSTYLANAS